MDKIPNGLNPQFLLQTSHFGLQFAYLAPIYSWFLSILSIRQLFFIIKQINSFMLFIIGKKHLCWTFAIIHT